MRILGCIWSGENLLSLGPSGSTWARGGEVFWKGRSCLGFLVILGFGALLGLGGGFCGSAAQPKWAFSELLPVLKQSFEDLDEEAWEAALGEALIRQFRHRILLEEDGFPYEPDRPAVVKTVRLEGPCSYIQVGRVYSELVPELRRLLGNEKQVEGSKGLILDLRFSGGLDFEAAGRVANLFVGAEERDTPLISWGVDAMEVSGKETIWSLPLVVLVNSRTLAAAEALAACLRVEQAAIVIGNTTGGRAALFNPVQLPDGQRIFLAVHPIQLGHLTLPTGQGWKPDISVEIDLQHERAYLTDPFTLVRGSAGATGGTNTVVRSIQVRPKSNPNAGFAGNATLADREQESGDESRAVPSSRPPENPSEGAKHPPVQDPVLARALDVLKHLSVLNR